MNRILILLMISSLGVLACKSKGSGPKKPGSNPKQQNPIKPEDVDSSSTLGSYARSLSGELDDANTGTNQYDQGFEKAKEDIFQQWQKVKNSSSYDSEFARAMLGLVENLRNSSTSNDYKLGYYKAVSEFYDVSIYKPTSISGLRSLLERYIQYLDDVNSSSASYEQGSKLGKQKSDEAWAPLKDESDGTEKFINKMGQLAEQIYLSAKDQSYKAGVMRGITDNLDITSVIDPVSVADNAKTVDKFEELLKKLQDDLSGVDKESEVYKKAQTQAQTTITKVWDDVRSSSTITNKEEQFYINAFKEIEKVNQEQSDHSYRSGFFHEALAKVQDIKAKQIDNSSIDYGRWTQTEFDTVRRNCWENALDTNKNLTSSQAYNLCTCMTQESAKRWEYQDFYKNVDWYFEVLRGDGVWDQCLAKA